FGGSLPMFFRASRRRASTSEIGLCEPDSAVSPGFRTRRRDTSTATDFVTPPEKLCLTRFAPSPPRRIPNVLPLRVPPEEGAPPRERVFFGGVLLSFLSVIFYLIL